MKELSIEEKAKAYEEVLALMQDCIPDENGLVHIRPEDIFPKLAESKDEKIRKWLICTLKSLNNSPVQIDGAYEMMLPAIAWLEKQGEQKPTQEIEPTPIFKIGDILKRKGKDYTFRVDRIQGGYYHCDRNHGAFFPIEEQGNWELVEQKPAWSEEDEKMLYHIICDIESLKEGLVYCKSICDEEITWLKSLKDRVQPQPKQEWSEEDRNAIQVLKDIVKHSNEINENIYTMSLKEKLYDWLKYLRPQTTWKPSEEQLKALNAINVTGCISYAGQGQELVNLFNDLKKLKE